MKRFFLMMFLLLCTLLLARTVEGMVRIEVDRDDIGPTTERGAFFDHRVRPLQRASVTRTAVASDAPQRRGPAIRFRYRDRGHSQVYLAGEVARAGGREELLALHYDAGTDRWEILVELDPGTHSYYFVVEDFEGNQRDRVDPANPRRRRDGERWVSEIWIDREGEVDHQARRTQRRRRGHDDYELDFFSNFGLAYQRVDGLVISSRPRLATREPFAPVFEGYTGYGFASEEWSVQGNFLQPLTPSGRLRLVLSGYDRTDFTDRTGVGDFENSVATLAFREDSRDWFRREGISAGVEADVDSWLLARLEIRSDTYRSSPRRVIAGWGGREDFLPNPEIDEGLLRSIFARIRLGNDFSHLWVEFEHADDALLSTGYEFTQLTAQYRSRMRLGRSGHLDLRARFGTALGGSLPRQKQYLAGGIGTVRGFNYQSLREGTGPDGEVYGGERLFVANAEYVMGSPGDLALACFVDTGNVWVDRDTDPFDARLRTSIGLGVMFDGEEGGLRLDLVRSLERGSQPIVQARLRRPF